MKTNRLLTFIMIAPVVVTMLPMSVLGQGAGASAGYSGAMGGGLAPTGALEKVAAGAAMAVASQQNTMPPALRAAIATGTTEQIKATIKALSGNDPAQLVVYTNMLIAEAEKGMATNPANAAVLAAVALAMVTSSGVQSAAPKGVLQVITVAARIFLDPGVQKAMPAGSMPAVAQTLATIATSPAIVKADPDGAVSVMAVAYNIVASDPEAAKTVAQILANAATNPAITAKISQIVTPDPVVPQKPASPA